MDLFVTDLWCDMGCHTQVQALTCTSPTWRTNEWCIDQTESMHANAHSPGNTTVFSVGGVSL